MIHERYAPEDSTRIGKVFVLSVKYEEFVADAKRRAPKRNFSEPCMDNPQATYI